MYPATYSLFFIVGFPANLLSLYVAWRLTMNGNIMSVYLISLCISDLLYTVTLPVWTEMALKRSVADCPCGVVYFLMYNSFYVGSGLLCCISVDRYLAIVYLLHFHWVSKMSTAVFVSTAVWILELLLHVLLLHHMGALKSFTCLCHRHIPMPQADASVSLVRVVLSFLVPVMSVCYQLIMHSLQQSSSILAEERRKVRLLLLFLLLTYMVTFCPIRL
nr:ovarian cancer G-protein coupled receptor 1-like [Nothobranchius furzeri]